jgi:hypothetical protein
MPSYICRVCKRKLKDITSVKLGIGPICRNRERGQQELFSDLHAVYDVVKDTIAFIHIKDIGHMNHKSVTTDIEYVLSELSKQFGIDHRRIFYTDSDGQIDEIIHNGKNFISIKSGHKGVDYENNR